MSRPTAKEGEASREGRQALLARLRAEVRRLEGEAAHSLALSSRQSPAGSDAEVPAPTPDASPSKGGEDATTSLTEGSHVQTDISALSPSATASAWTLGDDAFDAHLPGGCLDPTSLIELKPGDHGDWPATLAFAACLAVRRLAAGRTAAQQNLARPVLWCSTSPLVAEHGRLHGPGLAGLGLAPEALISVETQREADALWALEEGLRSGALSLAVGVVKEADLTPSRRLGLAAAEGRTPALLLTLPASAPAPSAAVRLRLRRLPSAPHPLDQRSPGLPRIRLLLERCRRAPLAAETVSLDLEWCDVTYRFRMVAGVGNRAFAAPGARERA
jgi:protein ImuA